MKKKKMKKKKKKKKKKDEEDEEKKRIKGHVRSVDSTPTNTSSILSKSSTDSLQCLHNTVPVQGHQTKKTISHSSIVSIKLEQERKGKEKK
ncbi:hypothetical protein V1477_015129 [Vespula maculifrons]|uniref:Uncharacterized protein n=1 Tax=Vespula maculifrons TaxID=7453 RepID=A0ABD2BKJ2_VESMC